MTKQQVKKSTNFLWALLRNFIEAKPYPTICIMLKATRSTALPLL